MTGSAGQGKQFQHLELSGQHRKLHDEERSDRSGDGKKGLRLARKHGQRSALGLCRPGT
jgi:hypothetical protein